MNSSIFRMYDVRGLAENDLNNETVYSIGRAFATYIKRNGGRHVVAGMDVRLSSSRIKEHFVRGVLDTGLDVTDTGVVTTPMLYFAQHHFKADGGIMVTGSHNPIEYNGLKMVDPQVSIYGDVIQQFRVMVENNDLDEGKGNLKIVNIDEEYIDMCVSKIRLAGHMKIAVDPGNGTAGPIAEKIFEKLNMKADFINKERDGHFPAHLPDPTVLEYIEELRGMVRQGDYNAGIGYDGDCDRVGIIDENGEVVYGDQILGMLAADMLSRNPEEKVVFDVKCSQGLEEYIEQLGGKPIMYKTGHSLLKRKMKEEKALIAGEMSGHMFFAENYFGFDDGLYASLLIMRILSEKGIKMSELVSKMPYYHSTPEIRVDCSDDDKFNVVEDIKKFYKQGGYRVIDIDGARVYFGHDGWALVRASNTQPILVVRIEAKSEQAMKSIKTQIKAKLSEYPSVKAGDIN